MSQISSNEEIFYVCIAILLLLSALDVWHICWKQFSLFQIIEEKIKTSGRFKEVLPFDIKFAAVESRLTSGGFGGGRGNRRGRGVRGRGGGRRGRRDGEDGEERSGPGSREAAVADSYDEDFPNLR